MSFDLTITFSETVFLINTSNFKFSPALFVGAVLAKLVLFLIIFVLTAVGRLTHI